MCAGRAAIHQPHNKLTKGRGYGLLRNYGPAGVDGPRRARGGGRAYKLEYNCRAVYSTYGSMPSIVPRATAYVRVELDAGEGARASRDQRIGATSRQEIGPVGAFYENQCCEHT